ncbi:MAG TPA: ABC transporter permease subunit, partial [Acinetobacter pseudolwoffii]|nr:ABC transporter permease subunit [Acinetobacter pseudolwoffii]
SLIEAGFTLGTNKLKSLLHVVIPAALPEIYRNLRVLLGWAWTYLIVAELIGSTSGITWFITQQARYQNFDNVFAAILIIGVIGLLCDVILMKLGQRLFKWKPGAN